MMRSSPASDPPSDCVGIPPTSCVPKKKSILRKDALNKEETETLLNNACRGASDAQEEGDNSVLNSMNDVFTLPSGGGPIMQQTRKSKPNRSLSEGSGSSRPQLGYKPSHVMRSTEGSGRTIPVGGSLDETGRSHLPLRDIASHMHMQTKRDSNDNPASLSHS